MFFVLSRAWDQEKKFWVFMSFDSSWGLSFFFPLSHARGKTKNNFLYWLLLQNKSVPYSSPCFPTENTIFLVFVKVLLWLFTIQGTIFIVVQNAQNKFIQHLIGFVWFNFFSEECFIPLYNSLAQIKKWLHCTPCIIQCPYQLLREMYTICQWLFDIVDRRKKHMLQPRTYCG